MNAYHIAWLIWAGAFFVIEFAALIRHRGQGDTLSECCWKVFAITGNAHAFAKLRRILLMSFCVWFTVHLMSGGKIC